MQEENVELYNLLQHQIVNLQGEWTIATIRDELAIMSSESNKRDAILFNAIMRGNTREFRYYREASDLVAFSVAYPVLTSLIPHIGNRHAIVPFLLMTERYDLFLSSFRITNKQIMLYGRRPPSADFAKTHWHSTFFSRDLAKFSHKKYQTILAWAASCGKIV
jgi:hypothetical protein